MGSTGTFGLHADEIKRRRDAYLRHGKNFAKAADELGIARSTLQHTILTYANDVAEELSLPDFPDDDIAIESVIDQLDTRFRKQQVSEQARTWFPVTLKNDKPIGVLWFGDPHLDDNGCNWPVLRQHIAICQQPGIYGANIGDTTNNWSGRLVRLYANQDTSVKTARRLAEWFMLNAGIKWLVFLIGNHDAWGDGAEILARMGKQYGTKKIICHDWEARFQLVFPNGWSPRIYAAHDFPGNSQWNPLHGPMKAGMMGDPADLYVCGHKHNWAAYTFENPARGDVQTFLRVRGYKFLDDYARHIGKQEQQGGCAILTIFDPADKSILHFENVQKGADYLAKLRA